MKFQKRQQQVTGKSEGTPILEYPEFEMPKTDKPSKKSRKRRRTVTKKIR